LSNDAESRVFQIQIEVEILARREKVWKALVEKTTKWWPKDFYAGKEAKSFSIEARLGGLMYEDWGEGAGLVWYTVIGLDPPRSIDLAGQLTPAFGGPATTMLRIALDEADEKRTILKLTDALVGRFGDGSEQNKRDSWMRLFGEGLKPFVEKARGGER
jgi:uncharacterized protein YndB with AHSA1/START domain